MSEPCRTSDAGRQTAPDPILRLDGLALARGGKSLLQDVTLSVAPGRCLIVMGANGAGKSLLLRVMHGLIQPDAGTVLWTGRAATAADRQHQAMVFQRPVMLRRSVRANLAFALKGRRLERHVRTARVDAALEVAKLDHLADRPARVLSGGEQQRLAVARALATRPEILFLDEPTASLDPASTAMIEAQLADARQSGVTIVLVTHDAGQARRLGDDLVFMHAGSVAEQGDAAQVLNTPSSLAARAWLGGQLHIRR